MGAGVAVATVAVGMPGLVMYMLARVVTKGTRPGANSWTRTSDWREWALRRA